MGIQQHKTTSKKGFTIVELIVVISVIGILATISIVGYSAWRKTTITAQVKSDLSNVASAMENYRTFNNAYPTISPTTTFPTSTLPTFTPSNGVTLTVQSASSTQYCVDGTSATDSTVTFYLASETKSQGPQTGTCAANRGGTTLPDVPTGLTVVSATAATINLSWIAANNASSYALQCASDSGFITGLQNGSSNGITGSVTGLLAANTHYCRIRSVNSVGNSAYTSSVSTNTTTLAAPSGFASTAVNDITITFGWTANPDATSYSVQCATNAGFTTGVTQAFTSTTNSVVVTGLTAYMTYYCRLNSINVNNTSAWTSNVSVTTTATFGTIAAATALTEVSPGPASATFSWTGISCSLGTPNYRITWVNIYSGGSTGWTTGTNWAGMTYPQQSTNIWKVQTKCTYSGIDSSITDSANRSFTSVGTADPTGAFNTIGWDGRFQFNVSASTYTCTSPATLQYQLNATSINGTSGSWTYGWTTSTTSSVTAVNQGSQMTTFFQVRCLYNAISSNVFTSTPRTDNASIDAPGTPPNYCAGTCGSPKGDSWGAVSCPAGTTAYYYTQATVDGGYLAGPAEAANFYGYNRGYYNGNGMISSFVMARCRSSYSNSAYGGQASAYY